MIPQVNKYLIYYPVQFLRREWPRSFLKDFKKVERFSKQEIANYQLICINQLIKYVNKYVPFYNGLKTKTLHNIRNLDEIQELPILTKRDIMKVIGDLESQESFLIHSYRGTSGTTGEPFGFFKDRLATSAMEAAMYTAYSRYGIELGDRQARIWGSKIHLKDRIVQVVKDFVLNRRRLSAFNMSEETCIRYYNLLKSFKPKYIYAYPNALYRFIQVLCDAGISPRGLNIAHVICTGEILFDYQRQLIENELGAHVINEYGTTENGIAAFECYNHNLHMLSQTILLEIIRPDGSRAKFEEEGEVVITELFSRSIPFIRYKTGDKATLSDDSCKCGLQMPILKGISGRIDDFIMRRDGQLVYDAILAYTLKSYARQFKAIQTDFENLIIYVVPVNDFSTETERSICVDLRKYLGNDMGIQFIHADKIEAESSGKFRYFVRKI